MRDVSLNAETAMFAQETGEEPLYLVTIDHDSFTQPIRVVAYVRNVVSRGHEYVACAIGVQLPDDRDDQAPTARLSIDNVGPIDLPDGTKTSLVAIVRSIEDQPSVTLEVVLASQPDRLEAGPFEMSLVAPSWDLGAVSAELSYEDVLNLGIPADDFTPSTCPGLFR